MRSQRISYKGEVSEENKELLRLYLNYSARKGLKKRTRENYEYELINFNGQSEYTHERGFSYYAGFNQFDMEQFKSLIKKYLSDGGT